MVLFFLSRDLESDARLHQLIRCSSRRVLKAPETRPAAHRDSYRPVTWRQDTTSNPNERRQLVAKIPPARDASNVISLPVKPVHYPYSRLSYHLPIIGGECTHSVPAVWQIRHRSLRSGLVAVRAAARGCVCMRLCLLAVARLTA